MVLKSMPGWAATCSQGQGPGCGGLPGHSLSSFTRSMQHRQCCQKQGIPVWKGLSHATSIHSITLWSTQGWVPPFVSLHKHCWLPPDTPHPASAWVSGESFWGLKLRPLEPGWGKMPTPHSSWPSQKCPSANTHFSHVPATFRRRQASHRCLPATDPPFLLHVKLHTSPEPRGRVMRSSSSQTSLGFPVSSPCNKHSTVCCQYPSDS